MRLAPMHQAAARICETRMFDRWLTRMERRTAATPRLRVVMYHRVGESDASSPRYPGLISACPQEFARQVAFLVERYHVVPLQDVVDAVVDGRELPPNAVLLTFDDATEDFRDHAWPVLRQYGAPATVFVPTAYCDKPGLHFRWDRLHRAVHHAAIGAILPAPWGPVVLQGARQRQSVFLRLNAHLKTIHDEEAGRLLDAVCTAAGASDPPTNGVLSWPALQKLAAEGVSLAPHTRTHPMLPLMSDEAVRSELSGSWDDLRTNVHAGALKVFAYPAGGLDDRVARLTAEAGFAAAFTTLRGLNDLESGCDPFRLRRIPVGPRTRLGLLRLQLLPQHSLL